MRYTFWTIKRISVEKIKYKAYRNGELVGTDKLTDEEITKIKNERLIGNAYDDLLAALSKGYNPGHPSTIEFHSNGRLEILFGNGFNKKVISWALEDALNQPFITWPGSK